MPTRQQRSEQELADLLSSASELGLLDSPPPFPLTQAVVDATQEGESETAEHGDVRVRIGADRVRIVRTRNGLLVDDRRNDQHYKTSAAAGRSPVMTALIRGEVGLLERAAAGDDSAAALAYDVAVAKPIMAELVVADDGPAEVMLAQAALAAFQLAGRAATRINAWLFASYR